LGTLIYEGVEL